VLADGSGAFTDIVDYVYVLDAGSVRGSGKAEQFVSAIPG